MPSQDVLDGLFEIERRAEAIVAEARAEAERRVSAEAGNKRTRKQRLAPRKRRLVPVIALRQSGAQKACES